MPNLPISGLPSASVPTGVDVLPIVQGGITSQITYSNLTSNFVTNSQTGSFVTNSQTSSFVTNSQTGSFVTNSQTGSFITNSQTSSFVTTSSFNTYTSSIQSYYLSAYHTASLTASVQNTPYSMSFSTTDFSNGITIGGPIRNQIQIANAGVYDIQFSAQIDKTSGTTVSSYIWLAKNGEDVPDSNTQITLAGGANDAQVAAWNFYVSASAGDYYELRYGATLTNFRIHYNTSAAIGPTVPSVILTVGRIA